MNKILAKYGVSVTDLKKNMSTILKKVQKESVVILNHNKPVAYIVSPQMYESIMKMVEEKAFEDMAAGRYNDASKNKNIMDVDIDEL